MSSEPADESDATNCTRCGHHTDRHPRTLTGNFLTGEQDITHPCHSCTCSDFLDTPPLW